MKHALVLVVLGVAACASADTPAPRSDGQTQATREPDRPPPPKVSGAGQQQTASDAGADPKAVAEARSLLKQGVAAYHVGAYDEAENLLKRSITIYPFLAPANLALGKVFLLKGAASRDESLIESARLMFDMAHTIDPSLREPVIMLELFKPRGSN